MCSACDGLRAVTERGLRAIDDNRPEVLLANAIADPDGGAYLTVWVPLTDEEREELRVDLCAIAGAAVLDETLAEILHRAGAPDHGPET